VSFVKLRICCLLGKGDLGFFTGLGSGSGVGSLGGGGATSNTGMNDGITDIGGGVGSDTTSGILGEGGGVFGEGVRVLKGSNIGSSNGGGITSFTVGGSGGSGKSSQSLPLSSSLSKVCSGFFFSLYLDIS